MTVFGLEQPDGSAAPISATTRWPTAATSRATGWGVSVSRPVGTHLRGGIEYSVSRAAWTSVGDADALGRWAPSAVRPLDERLHDVTTRLDTQIPRDGDARARDLQAELAATPATSSTRSRRRRDPLRRPGLSGRSRSSASPGRNWELVFAVRNLFRESRDGAVSVYDELLVVRPPKRVVGGVTVQF